MTRRHTRRANGSLRRQALAALAVACMLSIDAVARVPDWVQSHASVTVPTATADQAAILLYSETVVSVRPDGTLKRLERRVYRALTQKFASAANPRGHHQSTKTPDRPACVVDLAEWRNRQRQ